MPLSRKTLSLQNKLPLVSVIIPVYNAEKYLKECLDSILNQTYTNFEIICIDDGSEDKSMDILINYREKYPKRIRTYQNERNRGIGYTSNFGIERARGNLIARMDADDIMFPRRLELQANFLTKNPDVVLLGGQVVLIDIEGKILEKKKFPTDHNSIYKMLFTAMPIQLGGSMINQKLLPESFQFFKARSRYAEEVELFFRLLKYGKFSNLPNYVIKYRQSSSSITHLNVKSVFYNTLRVRIKAVRKYAYVPNLSSVGINIAQFILVSLLPTNLIYPAFIFLRKLIYKEKELKKVSLAFFNSLEAYIKSI